IVNMASDSSLKSLLTDDELSTINVQILDKLDIVFLKKENEIQEIKNDLVLSQTTNDRQIEELQKRLSEKENRLQQELVLSKSLQDQRVETEKRLSSLQSEITTLKESSAVVCGQLEQLKKDNLALSEEKSNLISVLKNKDKNIDELTNELKNVAEQLAAANQSKCDVLIKREELQTQELTLQYREKRLQQELKLANKQIDLSNAQINEKNQQLANITSEKVSEIFRLQNQVETNVDELKLSEEKVSNLTKMLEKQEKLGDSKNEQLQTLQKNSGQVEADYQHELRAQRKLADLYKKSNDDHECKVRELMKAVEELQKFIEQASFDHSELEGKYNTMVEQYEERLKEASKQIEDLNSELETANKLLSSSVSDGQVSEPSTSVADLYPEAVATSKVLRSYKSLTSLYSDFQRTEQELLKQKQENEELKQYLNNVLQEFDEKAPLLAQQKEDYEKALVTISVLNMKLDQAITDREQAYRERNNELRSAKFVTRENDRLKQKTTDLSSQVCLLLKEIEIYRGNYVPEDDQEVTSSCPSTIADESASSIIISKHLVSFRNIEELQKQNQQLLAVVRELSDEQEAKEKSAVDSRTSDLMTDLEAVKNQVGELKASRSRQETILESVVKQRDMYKTLLTETGPKQSSDEEVLNSKSLKDRSKEIDELNLTI
ncbi:TPR (predicted), partial [Pycnogonum litorale]